MRRRRGSLFVERGPIRSGEAAYVLVTITAAFVIASFFYFDRLSGRIDRMEALVGERQRLWGDITNYSQYLIMHDSSRRMPGRIVSNVQKQLGERLDADRKLQQQLSELVKEAGLGTLEWLFPRDTAVLNGADIQPSVVAFVKELNTTPSALLDGRFAELEPSDSILILSRKALLPLDSRREALQSMRAQLSAVRTPIEWIAACALLLAIWGVWFGLLRPSLLRSLEMKREIERSERRARVTLASIGDAVLVVGADGKVEVVNKAAEELLGVTQQSAVGQPMSRILELRQPGTERDKEGLSVDALATGGSISRRVEILRQHDGPEGLVSVIDLTSAPIAYPGQTEQGVVVVLHDVTAEHKMLEQIHSSDKARAVVGLAAALAHEFNNALAVISGARELMGLKLGRDEASARLVERHLKAIEGAVKQSRGLTAKLLAIGSKARLKLSVMNIMETLSGVVAMLHQSSGSRIKITLDARLRNNEHFISGDAASLQSAFLNLGINSIHAIEPPGEINVRVTTVSGGELEPAAFGGTPKVGQFVKIEWSDTGRGIGAEDLNRIFEPFFTTKASEGASGLGLSIVRGIIAEHRGGVSVASTPGEGTTFTIYLPQSTKPDPASLMQQRDMPREPHRSYRVLVVEDEVDFADVLREFLMDNGLQVLMAYDGAAAIDLYEKERSSIDVVVLDMNMPKKRGDEVESAIRKLDPDCNVIVSTGYLDPAVGAQLGLNEATVIIKKPYDLNQLLDIICDMCGPDR